MTLQSFSADPAPEGDCSGGLGERLRALLAGGRAEAGALAGVVLALSPTGADAAEFERSRIELAFLGGGSWASNDISRLPFWADLVARERAATPFNQPTAFAYANGVGELVVNRDPRALLAEVNERINAAPFVADSANWGRNDYWASTREFSQRGGDCEDFASAKYFALRALGFPADALRIVIVVNEAKQARHAVLMVQLADEVLVLDNLYANVMPTFALAHYRPLLAMNENTWQLAAPALRRARTTYARNAAAPGQQAEAG